MKRIAVILLPFVAICCAAAQQPYLRLPHIIGDNMVLQRCTEVEIYGWAQPRTRIVVTNGWNTDTLRTTVDGTARWSVKMSTPESGGPYSMTIKAGKITRNIDNILIGEVWLCSGQSNMEMSVGRGVADLAVEPREMTDNRSIRLFKVQRTTSSTPQDDCIGQWVESSKENIRWFSAVGFYFGSTLNKYLDMPVGLIDSSSGGTAVEAWTPAELINANPELVAQHDKLPLGGWDTGIGTTYNAMLYPLIHTAIAGVVWYQGEANVPNYSVYTRLLKMMISRWRSLFGRTFSFYQVQLAPFSKYEKTYGFAGGGAMVREAQMRVADEIDDCGIVCINDCADNVADIHPRYKASVGRRLAFMALDRNYGIKCGTYESPRFESVEIRGNKAYITLSGKRLTVRGETIDALEVCGTDSVFVKAEGRMNSRTSKIIVSSRKVDKIIAVRYAFGDDAVGNLFDEDGLPVFPFRTDNFKMQTITTQTHDK